MLTVRMPLSSGHSSRPEEIRPFRTDMPVHRPSSADTAGVEPARRSVVTPASGSPDIHGDAAHDAEWWTMPRIRVTEVSRTAVQSFTCRPWSN